MRDSLLTFNGNQESGLAVLRKRKKSASVYMFSATFGEYWKKIGEAVFTEDQFHL